MKPTRPHATRSVCPPSQRRCRWCLHERAAGNDAAAIAQGEWRVVQIDPDGREVEQSGRASFTLVRMRDDWKIVHQHFSSEPLEE